MRITFCFLPSCRPPLWRHFSSRTWLGCPILRRKFISLRRCLDLSKRDFSAEPRVPSAWKKDAQFLLANQVSGKGSIVRAVSARGVKLARRRWHSSSLLFSPLVLLPSSSLPSYTSRNSPSKSSAHCLDYSRRNAGSEVPSGLVPLSH